MGLQRTGWDLRSSSLFCVCARVGFHSTPTEENVHTTKKEDDATTPRWRLVVHSKGEEDGLSHIYSEDSRHYAQARANQPTKKKKKKIIACFAWPFTDFLPLPILLIDIEKNKKNIKIKLRNHKIK